MKTTAILLISMLLSISLFARENPFEPTDQFLEEKELMIKEQNAIEKMRLEEIEQAKIEEAARIQIEASQAIEAQNKADELIEEDESKNEIVEPYIPTVKENFKVLPFIKIDVTDDILTIQVDPKYQLLNQDILKPEKKFLFDFKGTISFYTIRNTIISEDFNAFAVGTHMKENYFRVVVDLPEAVKNYIEVVDSKKGIITIQKK